MSGTGLENSSEVYEKICYNDSRYVADLAEMLVAIAALTLHLFVLIAIISYRDVVKRSVVNIYAGNVVLSSALWSVWTICLTAELAVARKKGVTFEDHTTDTYLWGIFKESINLNSVLISSGSICLLINAMRSIQFRVRRTVGGVVNLATNPVCETPERCSRWGRVQASHKRNPKSWAIVYVLLVWLIPLIIVAVTSVTSKCKYSCHCNFHHTTKGVQNCKELSKEHACSILMPPLGKAAVGSGVGLWIFYLFILLLSLGKTYQDLIQIRKKRCESIRISDEENSDEGTKLNEKSGEEKQNEESELTPTKVREESVGSGSTKKGSPLYRSVQIKFNSKSCPKLSGSIFLDSLRRDFKLLSAMSIAYVIGSLPLIIFGLVDVATDGVMDDVNNYDTAKLFEVLSLLPLITQVACTLMISMYLSGVKSAVRALAARLSCSYVTYKK